MFALFRASAFYKSQVNFVLFVQRYIRCVAGVLFSLISLLASSQLMANEPYVENGVLFILGTNGKDQIQVSDDGSQWKIQADFQNGKTTEEVWFPKSAVSLIQVKACNGQDQIQMGGVDIPTLIFGDNGKDQIQGGEGPDTIYGGNGKDQIDGKEGDDTIFGGNGDDDIQGGNGNDSIDQDGPNDQGQSNCQFDAPNSSPTANAAQYIVEEDGSLVLTLTGADPDGQSLSFELLSQPVNGTLSGTAPNLTYTPNANYAGPDSLSFRVNDGELNSGSATIDIDVQAVNDAPEAQNQTLDGMEDTSQNITLTASDIDTDASLLSYSVQTSPQNGTLTGTAPNLTYSPNANYFGADSFTYTVSDGLLTSNTAIISINIQSQNDAPVANGFSVQTNEDSPVNTTLTGSDPDGDALTFIVVSPPALGVLTGTAPNLSYTPNTDITGTDIFTYRVNDGALDSSIASVSIDILAVNDAPQAQAESVITDEDMAVAITLQGIDQDSSSLTYTVVSQPQNGALSGTAPDLTYTPNTDFNGTDSFSFLVNDGELDSSTAIINLIISAINDAPVAIEQNLQIDEDQPIIIELSGSDVEGSALSYTLIDQPTIGTLSGAAPNLTYTPNDNVNGSDSFTFRINDGELDSDIVTVSLDITALNDAPSAEDVAVLTDEDTAVNLTLQGADIDGDAITYIIVDAPANGSLTGAAPNLTYTPNENENGSDSFTYKVNDGAFDSAIATVTVAVSAVNDVPIADAQALATDEDTGLVITLSGSDIDGDVISYTIVDTPTKGTLIGTAPNLTYTPNENESGADSFTFLVNDGELDSIVTTVDINVLAVNDVPEAEDLSAQTDEDVAVNLTLQGTDIDGDAITYSIVDAPIKGSLTGTAPNLTYTPDANENGSDSFTYRVNDGELDSNLSTVNLDIVAINDAPAGTTASINLDEDSSLDIQLQGTDAELDTLSFTVTSNPANGLLTGVAPDLTYTPNENYFGDDSFEFTVNDGELDSEFAQIQITVNPINDGPVITSTPTLNVDINQDYQYQVEVDDLDDTIFSYTLTSAPAGMTININGLLIWPQDQFVNGNQIVEVHVEDAGGLAADQTFELNVALEQSPVISSMPVTVVEATEQYQYQVAATDPAGQNLTYSLVSAPDGMTIDETTGEITWVTDLQDINATVSGGDQNTLDYCENVCDLYSVNFSEPISVDEFFGVRGWNEGWNHVTRLAGDSNEILFGEYDWKNFTFEVNLLLGYGAQNPLKIYLFQQENGDRYELALNQLSVELLLVKNGVTTVVDSFTQTVILSSGTRTLRVETQGNTVKYFYGNDLLYSAEGLEFDSGLVGLFPNGGLNSMAINWVNIYSSTPIAPDTTSPYLVEVLVTNESGLTAVQAYDLNVQEQNLAPSFVSNPALKATVGELYTYKPSFYDPNFADQITLSLSSSPAGMVVEDGILKWTPGTAGFVDVTVAATDLQGQSVDQSFTVQASLAGEDFAITSSQNERILEGDTYSYQLEVRTAGNTIEQYQLDGSARSATIDIAPETGLITGALDPAFTESTEEADLGCRATVVGDNEFLDLNNWTVVNQAGVNGLDADWVINSTGKAAFQFNNANPSMLISDFLLEEGAIEIAMTTVDRFDDDYMGFVWGYQDKQHYYRMRWGANPIYDFQQVSLIDTPESRFTGDHPSDVELIARADNTPWERNIRYRFILNVKPGFYQIQFYQGDILLDEYSVADETFASGGYVGFYNHSQADTIYNARLLSTLENLADLRAGQIKLSNDGISDKVTTLVTNRGSADVTVPFEVSLYGQKRLARINDLESRVLLNGKTLTGLNSGESITVEFDDVPERFDYDELYVVIDQDDQIPECTEDNNELTAPILQARVTTEEGRFDYQRYAVSVENVSVAPVIVSDAKLEAVAGEFYSYSFRASDADIGDRISYSLVNGPSGMFVNADTGLVGWTSAELDYGLQYNVTLRATDLSGDFTDQSYTINVQGAPEIDSEPVTIARVNELYQYQLNVNDPDGDALSYSIVVRLSGITVDANGLISWTPNEAQTGDQNVVVQVDDGRGGITRQSYTIYVFAENEVNNPPVITSSPITTVETGQVYSYQLEISDPEGNDITATLVSAPVGMTLNSLGLLEWSTTLADAGIYSIEIAANDGRGGITSQAFDLTVQAPNQAPVIELIVDQVGEESQLFNVQVVASDPEGAELTYGLSNRPDGMGIDANGLIGWLPSVGEAGDYVISVIVTDEPGLSSSLDFNLNIAIRTANELPVISSLPLEQSVVDELYTYQILATDADDDALIYSVVNGPATMIVVDNLVSWTPTSTDIGNQAITIEVNDGFGTVQQSWSLNVLAANTAPVITLNSPANSELITAPTDLVGSITDAEGNLGEWTVYLKSVSAPSSSFKIVGSGTAEASTDVLATLDPSLLLNGLYDLVVFAKDQAGEESQNGLTLAVEGDLKVGNFSFTVEDLNIPLAGLPISVTRTYDSRRKNESLDFGYGWSIGYQDVRVDESRTPGSDWELIDFPSGPLNTLTTYCVEPQGAPVVSVTLPTGEVERFEVEASPRCNEVIPILDVELEFKAIGDNQSMLEAVGNTSGRLVDENIVETSTFSEPLNPNRYVLTTRTGYEYQLNQEFGVETITDPNGYVLTFSDNGIVHSSGKSIDFIRDGQGRISQVIDPSGNAIDYTYDTVGDLTSVTERDGAITTHTYFGQSCDDVSLATADCHLLDELTDPLGRKMVKNIYDDAGRLIAQEDQNGNRTDFNHDVAGRQSIVTDRNNNTTVLFYDDRGNVTTQVDALGNSRTFTYDAQDNQLTQIDELGNSSSGTYNANNDQLTQTDELGNTLTYAYNSRGQETQITDARGNEFNNAYDSVGNLLSVTDPEGNIAGNNINAQGLVSSTVDVLGNSTSFTYDSEGNKLTETDALGTITSFTYDDNNNVATEVRTRTVGGSTVNETTSFVYDSRDRVTQVTDALGNITQSSYDLAGNQISQTDALGRTTSMAYDVYGNLLSTSYPDGTSESSTYDAENNLLTSTDRLGRTISYQYDALDRQTRITYPDGSFTRTEYDAVGRVVAEIDERGNRTEHDYDAAGRRTATEDALGNRHSFQYDDDGNLLGETDARSNSTSYSYNSLDQRTQTTFADSTDMQEVFDALGRRTQMTDQAGQSTDYEYDALGRLTKVTDALNQETTFTYDEQSNKLTQTDAEGRTTSWAYDALGRVISRALPLGQAETMIYDGNGNMTSHTDFNGNTHTYTYDINDRLTQIDYADGSQETMTYDDVGNRLSASITHTNGTRNWSYSYDSRDRLTQEVKPDGSTLAYGYDSAGNKTSLTVSYLSGSSYSESYTYDVLNRLSTVTDRNGNTTTYSYDAVGNRSEITNGNATRTNYSYDNLNRLTNLSHTTGMGDPLLSFNYELHPTGRRTKITEGTGRITDYVYDDLYRLTAESITDTVNGNYSASYSYDQVGNRTQETINGVTMAYSYDDNDRITQTGGKTFTYDAIGNTLTESESGVTVLYSYNSQNEMIERAEAGISIDYEYNVDGIRTGSGNTDYLVDHNRDYAQVLVEIDTGAEVVSYTYGDDLLNQNRVGTTHYYHYDGLGSTRGLTDDTATLTDGYDYEAFGETLNTIGSTDNSYLYTGEQLDANLDQYYLRARYYNPSVGRFTQMDTFQGFNQDPITLHKYLYAGNDPVLMIDPSGNTFLASLSQAQKVGLALAAATTVAYQIGISSAVFGNEPLVDSAQVIENISLIVNRLVDTGLAGISAANDSSLSSTGDGGGDSQCVREQQRLNHNRAIFALLAADTSLIGQLNYAKIRREFNISVNIHNATCPNHRVEPL